MIGGTPSDFDWVQDRGGYFWDQEAGQPAARGEHGRAFTKVAALVGQHKVRPRTVCDMLAVDRLSGMATRHPAGLWSREVGSWWAGSHGRAGVTQ